MTRKRDNTPSNNSTFMTTSNLVDLINFTPQILGEVGAWSGHLSFPFLILKELKPKKFVELGTHYGMSYFSFCKAIQELGLDTKCFAIDTWEGDTQAGTFGQDVFEFVQNHNNENYFKFSTLHQMTFDEGLKHFDDNTVDLLHIDGFHSYEAVSHDFTTWLPKLAPGAVVLFHDIAERQEGFGAWKFWRELKETYPSHLEFDHSHGLGVIQLNDCPASKKISWLSGSQEEKKEISNFFLQIGKSHSDKFFHNHYKKLFIGTQHELESQINRHNTTRQQHENEIQNLTTLNNRLLQEKNQQVQLTETLHEDIQNLEGTIKSQQGEISNLRNQIQDLEGHIKVKENEEFKMQAHVDSLGDALTSKEAEITSKEAEISSKKDEIAKLKERIDTINKEFRSSTSWKITKPVRAFGKALKTR